MGDCLRTLLLNYDINDAIKNSIRDEWVLAIIAGKSLVTMVG